MSTGELGDSEWLDSENFALIRISPSQSSTVVAKFSLICNICN